MRNINHIFICGPDNIKTVWFIEIDFHHYLGFYFFIFDRAVYPGRFNILWVLAKILYPEQFKGIK